MPLTLRRVCGLVGFGLLFAINAGAAEEPAKKPAAEPPPRITPHSLLVEHAKARVIPLTTIAVRTASATPQPHRPGDTITALISLYDGPREQQWLMTLQVSSRTEEEKKANVAHVTLGVTINHRSYKFSASSTLPLDITTIGPFGPGTRDKSEIRQARTMISPEFLALGMDRLSAGMIELEKSGAKEMPEPVERAFAGMMPALSAFFEAVQSVPALKSIVWDVIDLPSAWSLVKGRGNLNLGFGINDFGEVDAKEWDLASEVYRMSVPMSLNNQPALDVTFFVTAPRPPLLTTAGVVGIVATHPKKKQKRLEIRVVSAQAGAESK